MKRRLALIICCETGSKDFDLWLMKDSLSLSRVSTCTQEPITFKRASFRD